MVTQRTVRTKRKVLILTVLAGMGHIKAAEGITEGIRLLDENAEIRLIDPLIDTNPIFRNFINRSYLWMAKYTPNLWGFIYNSGVVSSGSRLFTTMYSKSILPIVEHFNPDIIASTHPFTTQGVAKLKREGLINTPLVGITTDFHLHNFGISKKVDVFAASSVDVKNYLIKNGIPEEKIVITGIPISPKFSYKVDKEYLKKYFKIKDLTPAILILSGGFGIGPIERLVKAFENINGKFCLLIVTGKDEVLKRRLRESTKRLPFEAKVFGYVNNMHELMSIASLVITKPGGLSSSEALAKGLPLIITKPIKGQETKNAALFIKEGVAIWPKRIEDIPKEVINLLSDKERYEKMQAATSKLAKPNAALDIAKILLEWDGGRP